MDRIRFLFRATFFLLLITGAAHAQQKEQATALPEPLSAEEYAALRELFVDRMQPGRYIRDHRPGSIGLLRNALSSSVRFPADSFSIIVDTAFRTAYDGKYKGIMIHLANGGREDVYFVTPKQGHIHIVMEARDPWGNWTPIEYTEFYGNSGSRPYPVKLASGTFISMIAPRYTGSFSTHLRLKTTMIRMDNHPSAAPSEPIRISRYSDIFEGSVNPDQFGVGTHFAFRYNRSPHSGPAPSCYFSGLLDSTGSFVVPPIYNRICPMSNGLLAIYTEGKWGVIDHHYNVIAPPLYDAVEPLEHGVTAVSRGATLEFNHTLTGGEWEFIDSTGKTITSEQTIVHSRVLVGGKTTERAEIQNIEWLKLLSAHGISHYHTLRNLDRLNLTLTYLRDSAADRFLYGLKDSSGRTLLEPIAESFDYFSDGYAGVRINRKWGFIDSTGSIAIEPQFDRIRRFSDGLAAVCINDKWGYVDRSGTLVVQCRFDRAREFTNNRAAVVVDGRYGFIDRSGKYVIPPIYSEGNTDFRYLYQFIRGTAMVCTDSNDVVVDRDGNILAGPYSKILRDPDLTHNISARPYWQMLRDAQVFRAETGIEGVRESGHYYSVDARGRYGLIRPDGLVIIEPQWQHIHPITDNLIIAFENDTVYSILDSNGVVQGTSRAGAVDVLIPASSTDGMIRIRRDGLYGFIDTTGTEVIPPQFVDALPFAYGRAVVMIDRRYGAINRNGEIVIPPSYEFIYPFRDGTAVVVIRQDDSDR